MKGNMQETQHARQKSYEKRVHTRFSSVAQPFTMKKILSKASTVRTGPKLSFKPPLLDSIFNKCGARSKERLKPSKIQTGPIVIQVVPLDRYRPAE